MKKIQSKIRKYLVGFPSRSFSEISMDLNLDPLLTAKALRRLIKRGHVNEVSDGGQNTFSVNNIWIWYKGKSIQAEIPPCSIEKPQELKQNDLVLSDYVSPNTIVAIAFQMKTTQDQASEVLDKIGDAIKDKKRTNEQCLLLPLNDIPISRFAMQGIISRLAQSGYTAIIDLDHTEPMLKVEWKD